MKCKCCGAEIVDDWIKIPELNIEVQKNLTHKSIKFKDLVIPKGLRLMTLQEGTYIYDNKILDNFPDNNWEMIEQFSKINKEKGYSCSALDDFNGRLGANGYYFGVNVNCCALGVRFVRELKAVKE